MEFGRETFGEGHAAVAARGRAGDKGAVDDHLETLNLGGSVCSMDALKRAGVDMTDPDVIRAFMVRFAETLDELEKLLAAQPTDRERRRESQQAVEPLGSLHA